MLEVKRSGRSGPNRAPIPPRSWTRLSREECGCANCQETCATWHHPQNHPRVGLHTGLTRPGLAPPRSHTGLTGLSTSMYTVVFVMTNNSKRTTTTPLDGMPRIGLHAGQYWIMWRSGGCLHHCLQAVTLYLPYGVDIIYMYNI